MTSSLVQQAPSRIKISGALFLSPPLLLLAWNAANAARTPSFAPPSCALVWVLMEGMDVSDVAVHLLFGMSEPNSAGILVPNIYYVQSNGRMRYTCYFMQRWLVWTLMMGVMYTSPVCYLKTLHLCNHIGRREMRRNKPWSCSIVAVLRWLGGSREKSM